MRLVRKDMNKRQGMNSEVLIFNVLLLKSAGKDGCRCTPNILREQNKRESFWQLAKRHKYSTYEKPFIFQISIQKVLLRVWEAELSPKLQYRYFWWKSIFVYSLIVAMLLSGWHLLSRFPCLQREKQHVFQNSDRVQLPMQKNWFLGYFILQTVWKKASHHSLPPFPAPASRRPFSGPSVWLL